MSRPKSRQNRLRLALQERREKIPPDIARLGDALWGDNEQEGAHQACLAALPAYVTAEVDGLRVAKLYPQVKRHLDTCDSCSEHYADVLKLALADLGSPALQTEQVPTPDLSFLDRPVALKDAVLKWTRQILATISPQQLPSLQAIADAFFEEVQALGGNFTLRGLQLERTRGRGGERRLREQSAREYSSKPTRGRGEEQASALAVLAVTYAAAEKMSTTLPPAKIDEGLRAGTLEQLVEASALSAAKGSTLDRGTVSKVARELAAQVAKDPQSLRAIIK